MIPFDWLTQAATRIAPHIYKTPLTYDGKRDLYIKWENHQVTGSFKARGALNKVLSLVDWEQARGLVTASAGNHGQGVALAAQMVKVPVTVFASDHAVPAKLEAMRALGATIQLVPGGYGEAEQAGLAYASKTGATWISPYNDGQVIAGQGTLGLETLAELPASAAQTWLVPAGGGGLVAGVGAALAQVNPRPRLIAVQSEASPFLHTIYQNGSQAGVAELPSLADGLAGPVEENAITIPLVQHYVDDFILVTEAAIRQAICFAWETYAERIEGSAAVGLAAIISKQIPAERCLVVVTGGNIQPELHNQIIAQQDG
jgi:threonine dehydratase